MAEQKESSVLFSLKELMNLEEQRIQEEEADRERRTREEMERKLASERAARDAEERRLRDEEEARRLEELRRREESTRLDAIRQGEIEKARTEAEHRARMEAMASQQAHEHQLAIVSTDTSKKRLQLIVGIVTAVLLIGGIGGGLAWKKSAEEADRKAAAMAADAKAKEEEFLRLKREFEEKQEEQRSLQQRLESAKDEVERAKLEADLSKKRKEVAAAGQRVSGGGGGGEKAGGGGAAKPCNCPPGDPLCSCL